jgi:hypothetical protein
MQEVASKVDWEGGIEDVLRWGLYANEVPLELEDEWKQMQQAFWAYERIHDRVSAKLDPYLGGPDLIDE